jgi:hypothetical protein
MRIEDSQNLSLQSIKVSLTQYRFSAQIVAISSSALN